MPKSTQAATALISAKSKEKQSREIKTKLIYYSCSLIEEGDLVFFFKVR